MQARRGFVEDEEDPVLPRTVLSLAQAQEVSELDALALTARKRTGRLSQLDVPQAHVHEGLQVGGDGLRQVLLLGAEEGDGLLYAHVQDVIDILVLVADFQDLGLEALAAAGFAHHRHVGHELHADFHEAVALALGAAAAVLVEGEVGRGETVDFRELLVAQEFADVVIDLQVGDGIGPGTLADGVLVHVFHPGDAVQVAGQALEGARQVAGLVDPTLEGRV